MSEPSPSHTTSSPSTGGVRAGGSIKADNIVTGAQVQGADAKTARALLALAQQFQRSGSVEAIQDIIAGNVVTGLQYIGQAGSTPDRAQFQQELTALRAQLAQAVQAGEIADPYEAEDVQKAADRAIEQTRTPQPAATRIATQLDTVATVVDKAATVATAAEKFQAVVIKLAPVVAVLRQLAGLLFERYDCALSALRRVLWIACRPRARLRPRATSRHTTSLPASSTT